MSAAPQTSLGIADKQSSSPTLHRDVLIASLLVVFGLVLFAGVFWGVARYLERRRQGNAYEKTEMREEKETPAMATPGRFGKEEMAETQADSPHLPGRFYASLTPVKPAQSPLRFAVGSPAQSVVGTPKSAKEGTPLAPPPSQLGSALRLRKSSAPSPAASAGTGSPARAILARMSPSKRTVRIKADNLTEFPSPVAKSGRKVKALRVLPKDDSGFYEDASDEEAEEALLMSPSKTPVNTSPRVLRDGSPEL